MGSYEVIERLCGLLDEAQQIIRAQAELLAMHGIETDSRTLEYQRSGFLREVQKNADQLAADRDRWTGGANE